MTLVKRDSAMAGRAADFRSLRPTAPAADTPTPSAEDDSHARHLAVLSDQVTELEGALADARDAIERARTEAFEQGRAEGLEAAETLEREKFEALAASLREAVAGLGDHIDRERDVAIDIARCALDRLFGDPSLYAGMVAETAQRHASALARGAIVALRVSAQDFPDADALAMLPPLGTDVRVEADPGLARGTCLFDLTLGSADASVGRQASIIENIFVQAERKAASA